jgi:hypothetical protein
MAEYYLLCTAGYRVTLDREKFVEQAACEFHGGGWPELARQELDSALDRLLYARLMGITTEADVEAEKVRRAASDIPELDDGIYYQPGHVDFTEAGHQLYRDVIAEIRGDRSFARGDSGFNLDPAAGRVDVYAVAEADCQSLMDEIEAGGDAFIGIEGTSFVGKEGPTRIGPWRPIRFVRCPAGYHGVVRFNGEVSQ